MKNLSALFVFLLLLCSSLNLYADSIAQVILAKGTVMALSHDGETRALKRRSKIYSGDSITTATNSSVQIRFVDKALMTIKANSKFNISEYHLAGGDADTQKNKAFMKLLKGGFRTITGSIGKGDKQAYRVDTPAASIGIRGTNYEVQQEKNGDFVVAVYSGGVRVHNSAGSIDLGFGSDYNFTRVKKDTPPKGLLIPPISLADNSTAPSENEKTKDTKETKTPSDDVLSDNKPTQIALNTHNQIDNIDRVLLSEPALSASPDTPLAPDDTNTDEPIASDDASPVEPIPSDDTNPDEPPLASNDTDQPRDSDDVIRVPTDIPDDATPEPTDIPDDVAEVPDDVIPVPTDIPDDVVPEPPEVPSAVTLFDFDNPYLGINPINSPMPSAIDNMNYALAESGELGFMTMGLSYSQIQGQHVGIGSPEAGLSSPDAINDFNAYDFSSNQTSIKLLYQIIDINTGDVTEYEQKIEIDINSTSLSQLQNHINNALTSGNVDINGVSTSNPGYVTLSLNDNGDRLIFSANSADGEYMTEMELKFKNYGTASSHALMAQMGSPDAHPHDWLTQTNISISLAIGNGAWDQSSNSPLMLLNSQVDENGETIERTEVFYKPVIADETVDNLNSFLDCTSNHKICDIQVDNVAAAENIRWGAWLSEPTDTLQVHQQDTDADGNVTNQLISQDNTLNFWLAAQRADINQLSGSASFSGSANCSDFSQCMGVSDDGMVQSISGQFDVNFNNGNISNGQLTVNTAAANSSIYNSGIAPLSTWQVNFDGQMTAGQPEFQSQNLTGSVSEGGIQVTDKVVGNVGGIFVKPGDVFAGGYNLGTKGDSGKHTAGVFTLDKQP